MWFRPGNGQSVDFDKFRVSSFKRRIRGGRKTPEKSSSIESENIVVLPSSTNSLDSNDNVNEQQKCLQHKKSLSDVVVPSNLSSQSPSPSLRTSLSRRISRSFGDKEKNDKQKEREKEKEKILLTDRKFKNNRIEKSSSKGKGLNDIDKRESIKGRRDARKISAPPILIDNKTGSKNTKIGSSSNNSSAVDDGILSPAVAIVKKNSRAHSNLNLNALYKLVSSGNKKLSSEDFARIRRKSLSEAAAPVIAVATSKQLPLNLNKESSSSPSLTLVTESNKRNDRLTTTTSSEEEDKSDNESDDNIMNNNIESVNNYECINGKINKNDVDGGNNIHNNDEKSENSKEKNDENNGKNDEDEEVFYPALSTTTVGSNNNHQYNTTIENENCKIDDNKSNKNITNKKISSPSLTSRVAAKITETTNNYKNRKSKMPKKRKSARRPEYYKQISIGNEKIINVCK